MNEALDKWLWQPIRGWELAEAEANGQSVLELRQEFLRQFKIMVKGFGHERWIN